MNNTLTLTRDAARAIDQRAIKEFGIPGAVLMENAGRGIFDYLLAQNISGNILVCCGKGNNAGDGFVIARYLANTKFSVQILLFTDPTELQGDAKLNFDIAKKLALPITIITQENFNQITPILSTANWIIDALFGTGLRGTVKPPFDKIIQAINAANKNVLSIDIPSGLDCDTGEPLGVAVKATHTATVVSYKKGFTNSLAIEYLGKIHVVDIGIPRIILEEQK